MWEQTHVTGPEAKAAVRRSSIWGTAALLGPRHGIRCLPHTIDKARPNDIDDSLGLYHPRRSDPGSATVKGTVPMYMYWDMIDFWFASIMGGSTNPEFLGTPISGTADSGSETTLVDTGAFVNVVAGDYVQITHAGVTYTRMVTVRTDDQVTFPTIGVAVVMGDAYEVSVGAASKVYTLTERLTGIFGTLAYDYGLYIEEFPSIKSYGFKIRIEAGKPWKMTVDVEASDLVTNSAVNTLVTMALVTEPTPDDDRFLHKYSRIRLNEQSGSALGSGDVLADISSVDFTFKRNLKGFYGVGGNSDIIGEPGNDKRPEYNLAINLGRLTGSTHFDNWEANKVMKADMYCSGPEVIPGVSRSWLCEFPHLRYAGAKAPQKEGIFDQALNFNILEATSAPAGMAGLTLPFRMTMVNGYCGDPLQE